MLFEQQIVAIFFLSQQTRYSMLSYYNAEPGIHLSLLVM